MGYQVYTVPQVTPRQIERPGILGPDIIDNPEQVTLPIGATVIYQPETFDRFADDPAQRLLLLVTPDGTATGPDIFAAFPGIKALKRQEIDRECDKWLDYVTGDYSEKEKLTFNTQQRQAEEWLLDNNAPCLTVRNMAADRGITVAEMVAKIMENVPPFERGIGMILGKKQRLVDQINATTDYDILQTIRW
jgi:hypothetical protein